MTTPMLQWNVATDIPVANGEAKGFLGVGGGFRPFMANLDRISGNYYHFAIYIDAPNEADPDENAQMVAMIRTRQGIWVKHADASITTGMYADMMKQAANDPVQRAVGNHLDIHRGDSSYGYGAFPALAWKAFMLMQARFIQFIEFEIAPYISRITGGKVDKLYLVAGSGTAGGTGPGILYPALETLRDTLHGAFPQAGISIREMTLDGFAWEDCGPKIMANAALSASRIHYHGTHPGLLVVEDRRHVLLTLPRDGRSRERRNQHVNQLCAMLHSPEVDRTIRANAINEASGADYGQFLIVEPVYFPLMNEADLLAAIAGKVLSRVRDLTSGNLNSHKPTPISRLQLDSRITGQPEKPPKMLLESVRGASAADDASLLDNLVGRSNGNQIRATATSMAVYAGGSSHREARHLIAGPMNSAQQLIQRIVDTHHLLDLVNKEIADVDRQAKDNRFDADDGRTGLSQLLKFTYGTWTHKLWNAWPARDLIFHSKDDRIATIGDRADEVRKLETEAVTTEAKLQVLTDLREELMKAKRAMDTGFESLITTLTAISRQGIPFDDVNIVNLDEIIIALMWASGFADAEVRVKDVLRGAIRSVGMTSFARTLGYSGSAPVDAQMLAAIIVEATPESIGMRWGRASLSEGPQTDYMLLPLDPADIAEVDGHIRRLSPGRDVIITQLNCGAGVFMGGLKMRQVTGAEDVETPTHCNIIARLHREPVAKPGLNYLLGMVPGIPVINDSRNEIGRQLGLIPAEDATATDNQ